MMTVCRVIQGIGGAFLMPVGRLVILRSYPCSMFVNVLNIVTIPALLGPFWGRCWAVSSYSTLPGTGYS